MSDKLLSRLREQVRVGCLRLLNEQNRDRYAPAYGCFDRRFWGWKLVDYPEATFQRAVYPLAWLLDQPHDLPVDLLRHAITSGLTFATAIQHRDGSFDQAFPHEHSFGATAFLLHPLLYAYQRVQDDPALPADLPEHLHRAAVFLQNYNETHGHIANHLAGGALSLLEAGRFFGETAFTDRARQLIDQILAHQSSEGWFLEYEGADPGYQTLCMTYLAQCRDYLPDSSALDAALARAVEFLAYFVHPDGSFGGEYGSRRTGVYYPGGIALLAKDHPTAHWMTQTMLRAILDLHQPNALTIDMGNLVPVISGWLPVFAAPPGSPPQPPQRTAADFPEAGLHIRANDHYYTVIGSANGGVMKVFAGEQLCWDDGGYVAELENGRTLSTQTVDHERKVQFDGDTIEIHAPFYEMSSVTTSPLKFIALRLLNITLMRNIRAGNFVKALLVRLLITGKKRHPLMLKRRIHFARTSITVEDVIETTAPIRLKRLTYGAPFVAIHMASARYLTTFKESTPVPVTDLSPLAEGRSIRAERTIAL